MRQAVIIIGMMVMVLIVGITVMSVNSKSTRKDELENAVATAVQQTVKYSGPSENPIYASNEEMMASFVKNLTLNMNSDGDIEVEIYGADYEKGLLSVKVTQFFKYVTGKEASIEVRKTAIYE